MAVTRETLGGAALFTSIHGRRLGLDDKDQLSGHTGSRTPVEDATTTSGSSLTPYGTTRLAPVLAGSSGAVSYTLQAMAPGTVKTLTLTSTTTAGVNVVAASGHYFSSTSQSSGVAVTFYSRYGVMLQQISTVAIAIMGTLGSTTTAATS